MRLASSGFAKFEAMMVNARIDDMMMGWGQKSIPMEYINLQWEHISHSTDAA